MGFVLKPAAFAQGRAKNSDVSATPAATARQDAIHPKLPENAAPNLEEAVPIDTEKIDHAGQELGEKIDAVSAKASGRFGGWINCRVFGDISWLKLIVCFALILFVLASERAIRRVIASRLESSSRKPETGWGSLILDALFGPLTLFIRVYGIYWALSPIWIYFDGPGGISLVHKAAGKAADLGGTVAIFWFIHRFVPSIDFKVRKWIGSSDNGINDMLVPMICKIVRVFVLVVGGMLVVQNMTGIELGPLVASLGIGGLAIALAGKDSIANFLGSLTILLDKPFGVGDRIVIDNHDGFVEEVGFRSTRIRTLTGNLVSVPNERIISATLENVARRSYLRWNTELGLTCETGPEKVERAVQIVEEILTDHEGMRSDYPPKVHFNGFKDWSLNLSIYAWYFPPAAILQAGNPAGGPTAPTATAPDFWKFQGWVQKTCLEIMHRFRIEGIEMAYPTQAVYQVEGEKEEPRRGRNGNRPAPGPNALPTQAAQTQKTLKDAIELKRKTKAGNL